MFTDPVGLSTRYRLIHNMYHFCLMPHTLLSGAPALRMLNIFFHCHHLVRCLCWKFHLLPQRDRQPCPTNSFGWNLNEPQKQGTADRLWQPTSRATIHCFNLLFSCILKRTTTTSRLWTSGPALTHLDHVDFLAVQVDWHSNKVAVFLDHIWKIQETWTIEWKWYNKKQNSKTRTTGKTNFATEFNHSMFCVSVAESLVPRRKRRCASKEDNKFCCAHAIINTAGDALADCVNRKLQESDPRSLPKIGNLRFAQKKHLVLVFFLSAMFSVEHNLMYSSTPKPNSSRKLWGWIFYSYKDVPSFHCLGERDKALARWKQKEQELQQAFGFTGCPHLRRIHTVP